MASTRPRLGARISQQNDQRLKRLSKVRGRSMAAIVDELLTEALPTDEAMAAELEGRAERLRGQAAGDEH